MQVPIVFLFEGSFFFGGGGVWKTFGPLDIGEKKVKALLDVVL